MLKEGDLAPDFSLQNEKGETITLGTMKGKMVVLYFYPKDDTPGCTVEACAFRDAYDRILEMGAVVIGISKDDAASHEKFKKKYNLPFYLLVDAEHKVIEAYDAWDEKAFMGIKSMGTLRKTFVIDQAGKIKKIFPDVKPDGHAQEVLSALK